MFIFIPNIGGNDPIWRSYLSDGLVQPPTSFPWWMALILGYLHTYKCYHVFFLEILLGDTHGDFDEIWGITHMIWLKPQKNWTLIAGSCITYKSNSGVPNWNASFGRPSWKHGLTMDHFEIHDLMRTATQRGSLKPLWYLEWRVDHDVCGCNLANMKIYGVPHTNASWQPDLKTPNEGEIASYTMVVFVAGVNPVSTVITSFWCLKVIQLAKYLQTGMM